MNLQAHLNFREFVHGSSVSIMPNIWDMQPFPVCDRESNIAHRSVGVNPSKFVIETNLRALKLTHPFSLG